MQNKAQQDDPVFKQRVFQFLMMTVNNRAIIMRVYNTHVARFIMEIKFQNNRVHEYTDLTSGTNQARANVGKQYFRDGIKCQLQQIFVFRGYRSM